MAADILQKSVREIGSLLNNQHADKDGLVELALQGASNILMAVGMASAAPGSDDVLNIKLAIMTAMDCIETVLVVNLFYDYHLIGTL